jgi:hypothetical protein
LPQNTFFFVFEKKVPIFDTNTFHYNQTIMSEQKQAVTDMVHQYVQSVGLTREQTYKEAKERWNWKIGSANIEVYIETITFSNGNFREYLRIFSPLLEIPVAKQHDVAFYRYLLELNDGNLGVKLTVVPNTNWIYATYERDIRGIDYDELVTCIYDMELWADKLDDELKIKFAS